MNFNSLVFPAPKPSYTVELLGNDLIWIPKYSEPKKQPSSNNGKKAEIGKPLITAKNHDMDVRITEKNFENPLPKYMTPQASITKKFDFNSYNKRYCNIPEAEMSQLFTQQTTKHKPNLHSNRGSFMSNACNENYEERDDDLQPRSVRPYYTKTFDAMNAFTKYAAYKHKPTRAHFSLSEVRRGIPCLLAEVRLNPNPEFIILFFHGNGEDIWLAFELIDSIRQTLKVRILAPEYPGYGVYTHAESSADQLLSDAENCYNYLVNVIGYPEDKIILIGRSIGSGPATYLAAKKKPLALILISGFTSLQGVVEGYAGGVKHLIKERFVNIENMQKIESPTLLIHGLKDRLISFQHSKKLHDACKGPCELLIPKEMTHFEFDFEEDMSLPILMFLLKWGVPLREKVDPLENPQSPRVFPIEVYFKPNN